MFDPSEIHRLNTDRFATTHGDAKKILKKRHYLGKPMVSGEDAAIEIVGDKIITTVCGQTDYDNKAFDVMVEAYRSRLVAAYHELARSDDDPIVISGVWHSAFIEYPPYLEPYMLHHVTSDGKVSTRRYDLNVFAWDSWGDGPIMRLRLNNVDGIDAHMQLRFVTENEVIFDDPKRGSTGKAVMQGIVWYPDPAKKTQPADRRLPLRMPLEIFRCRESLERSGGRWTSALIGLPGRPASATC